MIRKEVIPNEAFSATTFTSEYEPEKARFGNGGWKASHVDVSQWIQVDLGNITKVTGIVTQGIFELHQWVTKYSISYSLDGDQYMSYKNDQVRVMSEVLILA